MGQFEATHARSERVVVDRSRAAEAVRPAYRLLQWAFVLVPLAAGIDKFFMVMADWRVYLWPGFPDWLGLSAHDFMRIVGGIEILAAVIVLVKPAIGGYVVGAWLLGIIVNLFLLGAHWDILLRDFGLCLAAFALAAFSRDARHR